MLRRMVVEITGEEDVCNKIRGFVHQNPGTMRILEDRLYLEKDRKIVSGALEIDIVERLVKCQEEQVILTAKEFDILYYLASCPGKTFSHKQIYEAVWQKEYFQDAANITAYIGHIRKKLQSKSDETIYIQTVHGLGYKFNQY